MIVGNFSQTSKIRKAEQASLSGCETNSMTKQEKFPIWKGKGTTWKRSWETRITGRRVWSLLPKKDKIRQAYIKTEWGMKPMKYLSCREPLTTYILKSILRSRRRRGQEKRQRCWRRHAKFRSNRWIKLLSRIRNTSMFRSRTQETWHRNINQRSSNSARNSRNKIWTIFSKFLSWIQR